MGPADDYPLELANRPALVCDGHIGCGHGSFEGHYAAVIRARVSVRNSTLKGGGPEPKQEQRMRDMSGVQILP